MVSSVRTIKIHLRIDMPGLRNNTAVRQAARSRQRRSGLGQGFSLLQRNSLACGLATQKFTAHSKTTFVRRQRHNFLPCNWSLEAVCRWSWDVFGNVRYFLFWTQGLKGTMHCLCKLCFTCILVVWWWFRAVFFGQRKIHFSSSWCNLVTEVKRQTQVRNNSICFAQTCQGPEVNTKTHSW